MSKLYIFLLFFLLISAKAIDAISVKLNDDSYILSDNLKLNKELHYKKGNELTVAANIEGNHHQIMLSLVGAKGHVVNLVPKAQGDNSYSFKLNDKRKLNNDKYTAHLLVSDIESDKVFLFFIYLV